MNLYLVEIMYPGASNRTYRLVEATNKDEAVEKCKATFIDWQEFILKFRALEIIK